MERDTENYGGFVYFFIILVNLYKSQCRIVKKVVRKISTSATSCPLSDMLYQINIFRSQIAYLRV